MSTSIALKAIKSEDFIEQFKFVKRYVSKIYMVITQAINYIPVRPLNYQLQNLQENK